MTTSLLEKARAGRRAALASLNAQAAITSENVVSLFEGLPQPRKTMPEFRSVRRHADTEAAPVLMLTERLAA
jgi:hypothetical protein